MKAHHREQPAPAQKLPALLPLGLLVLLAFLGYGLSLPLFFGVNLLLGSAIAFLALMWLGPWIGVLTALLGASAVWLLWGQPVLFGLFVAEIAFIAWRRQRARSAKRAPKPFAADDAIYWLAFGMPVLLGVNTLALGLDWPTSWISATQHALNGILNAAIAGLVVLTVARMRHRRHNITLGRILFNVLVLAILIPAMLLTAWQDRNFKQKLETDYALRAKLTGALLVSEHAEPLDPNACHPDELAILLDRLNRRLDQVLPARWEARFALADAAPPAAPPAASASTGEATWYPTSVDDLAISRPRQVQLLRTDTWHGARYRVPLTLSLATTADQALALSFSADPLLAELRAHTLGLLLVLLGLALFGLALAAWLSAWLTGPLRQLAQATQQLPSAIARAQPLPELPSMSIHETDVLANTITSMARSLHESFDQLEREKQRQSRQQAIAELQAQVLSKLIDEDDVAGFAEYLCEQVERWLPDQSCALLRRDSSGRLAPFTPAVPAARATAIPAPAVSINALLEQPAFLAACQDALDSEAVRVLAPDTSASTPQGAVSGLLLPVANHDTLLVALERQALAADADAVDYARELLEAAASLAGVAFESLQLRRRHQVLIDALSQAQTGVIITERTAGDDLMIYVNSGFEAMTGYRADEVIGRNCRFLQGDDREQEARWQMRSALKDGDATSVIMRNYRKDGSRFWNSLYISPMRDRHGRVTHYIGVQQDVTEAIETLERLRFNEGQLREAEERYRMMLENVEDFIIRVDMQGHFEFVTPSYCRIFGRTETEMLGRHFAPFVYPDDHALALEAMQAVRSPPHVYNIEHRARTPHGERWFQWSVTGVHAEGDEVVAVIGVGRDITERKQAELALAERETMMTELLTLATRFVGVSDESLDAVTDESLARIGHFMGADRAYLFRLDEHLPTITNTHEWSAEGIPAVREQNIGVPIAKIPMIMATLFAGEPLCIERVDALEDDNWAEEREILERQQVQSLLLAPVQLESGLVGFAGIETVRAPHRWSTVETQFLQLFANIFAAGRQRASSIAALRHSNSRYDTLARQSRTITWELNVQGRFSFISEVCEPVLGYASAEMLGRHYADFIAEREEPGHTERAAAILANEQPFEDFVAPFRTNSGNCLWLSTDGAPMYGTNGELVGFHGITKDVTERQLALKRLAQSESRMSAIFNNAPIGIALIGRDRRPLMVNRALSKLLDRSAKALVGMRFDDFTHPEDQHLGRSAFEELLTGQRAAYRVTKRYLRPNGETIWCDVRISLLPASASGRAIPLAMIENVTELHDALERQRAAEQELVEYAGQLESLIDLVNVAQTYAEQVQALLQLACRALAADDAALGLLPAEADYQPLFAVAAEEQAPGQPPPPIAEALLAQARAEPGAPVVVTEATAAERCLLTIALLLETTTLEGDQEQLLMTLRRTQPAATPQLDIAERQLLRLIAQRLAAMRHQHELQQNLVQSRERETIGHLASGVSHDFNNLLGVIDANLFFITDDLSAQISADPELTQIIAETRSALDQAKVITSGMLTMSRSGAVPLERIDLAAILDDLERILHQILPTRIRLEIALPDQPHAYSNRAFLQSALLNLSLNARDAIRETGTLSITGRWLYWDATTPLNVGTLDPMDCFELRVSDDGSGIPQELLRQIFEPLFSTKAKNRGHGLGLFMVREFIVRTQAGLIVESAPGRTSFRILLPAHSPSAQSEPARLEAAPAPSPAPDAAPTASPNKAPAKVGEAQARVLLVEDDRRVRDALSRLLRIDGLEVETADNGQEALEQLAALTVPVDLVLSDIAMPVMDGLDLYAQLSEQYPHLPVILMTGQQAHWEPPLDGHGEPALILRKPIELGTLQLAIRNKIRHAKDHDGRL